MIRQRLGRALDWRVRAIVDRLDALAERVASLDVHTGEIDARMSRLTTTLDQVQATLEQQVQPVLQTIAAAESSNRRRLHELRAAPDYELAYSHPDPLVSITIATVGGRDALIERSLPSLLAQTHANLEILVVGDAAPDAVGEAVVSLGDERLHYSNLSQRITAHPDARRHQLVGSTMARNEATRRAHGLWLVHFDDDDHLRPDAISSLLGVARKERAEVAYGGFEQHHPERQSARSIAFPPRPGVFSWAGALVHGGLRFFERELVAAHLRLPGDMYMLERMLRAGVRFAMLDEVVLDYFPSRYWEP